jgi:hypothetical protein
MTEKCPETGLTPDISSSSTLPNFSHSSSAFLTNHATERKFENLPPRRQPNQNVILAVSCTKRGPAPSAVCKDEIVPNASESS